MERQTNFTVTCKVTAIETMPIRESQVTRLVINFYICPELDLKMDQQDYNKILLAEKHRKCLCQIRGMNLRHIERTITESVLALKLYNRNETALELGLDIRTLFNRFRQYRNEDRIVKLKQEQKQ